jgi:hypothetical protein
LATRLDEIRCRSYAVAVALAIEGSEWEREMLTSKFIDADVVNDEDCLQENHLSSMKKNANDCCRKIQIQPQHFYVAKLLIEMLRPGIIYQEVI